jgi:hypothetical protein
MTSGLQVEVADSTVEHVRGGRDDVFSRGYLCLKGPSLKGLYVENIDNDKEHAR